MQSSDQLEIIEQLLFQINHDKMKILGPRHSSPLMTLIMMLMTVTLVMMTVMTPVTSEAPPASGAEYGNLISDMTDFNHQEVD